MTRTTRRKLTIGAIIDEIEEEESEDIACKGYFKVFLELEKNSNWIYIYKEPERTGFYRLGGKGEMPSNGDLPTCQMVQHGLLTLQYRRSIYQKCGIGLRSPRIQPSDFHNWDRRQNED